MNEPRLTYLFEAYFNKTATSKEHDELMELLVQSENDEELKLVLASTWQQFKGTDAVFSEGQGDDMIAHILKNAPGIQAPVISLYKRPFNWLRISAAAILVFVITGLYFWLTPIQSNQQLAKSKVLPHDTLHVIEPGGNKAILTLADGSSIVLDSVHDGTLAKQGSTKIMKLNTATLSYQSNEAHDQEKITYNTLSTPSGGQYQLILPDGTKVWLNASSSIHFPTLFSGKERKVTIAGEAYFEVSKNEDMPFKVAVNDVQVQVLGTHFNVMAYNEENSINTTLLEGSVKISRGADNRMLIPGEQSIVQKSGNIKVIAADVDEVMAWKNGWFQFNAYSVEKVMRQISRWYNVEVVYEGKIPAGHFSGLVSRRNDISQVLKIMEMGGVRFKVEKRKVIVLP